MSDTFHYLEDGLHNVRAGVDSDTVILVLDDRVLDRDIVGRNVETLQIHQLLIFLQVKMKVYTYVGIVTEAVGVASTVVDLEIAGKLAETRI